MPSVPDQDARRTRLAATGIVLIPVLCCGLPLLVAAGGLGVVGSILGQAWLIGLAALLAVVAVWWAVRRRTNVTEGDGGCSSRHP